MDESGHDHKNMPLEVRGGVAIHASKVWPFIQAMQKAEVAAFGFQLSDRGLELKGSKLLENKRCEWANQEATLSEKERHNGVNRFVTKSQQKAAPSKRDFTAYGQACKLMAHSTFRALKQHEARIFAGIIPRGIKPPADYAYSDFLRKDQIFMQERFYWFLEAQQENGLFVMDQTEKQNDKRYIRRLHDYYKCTRNGKQRARWIVPSPMFVDSELAPGVQAADLCLYCINWGFRRPEWNFKGAKRDDIHAEFAGFCGDLQHKGQSVNNGKTHQIFGIVYVPDPYVGRKKFG
ncbi:DUF3800 domain-containing protein [Aliiroseovarius sp.]|uniref:DUF3800 domain-containing protein n=1 Tax=Aliiroseovarius sp. TaxID=1872442 RepID=UPI003BAB57DA